MSYLRNAWYVAALSSDLVDELKALKILDQRIVMYRRQDGRPAALEDACPHRKLPLSMGRLQGDALECGYHGLRFDGSGTCIAAPTQSTIPPTAQVRSFPLCERYGLIWIWMGTTDLADEHAVPEIKNFDNASWDITTGDMLDCACHYLHLVDNLLDPSHVAWVHQSSFAADGTESTAISININENGVIASRWILDREPPPFYAPLLGSSKNIDRLQHYEMRFPSVAINKSIYTAVGNGGDNYRETDDDYVMISYNFLTPVDAVNTRYFWLQHRNAQVGDQSVTRQIAKGARDAFEEDRAILEAVQRGMDESSAPRITLGIDAAAVQYRRALHKRIEAEAS